MYILLDGTFLEVTFPDSMVQPDYKYSYQAKKVKLFPGTLNRPTVSSSPHNNVELDGL